MSLGIRIQLVVPDAKITVVFEPAAELTSRLNDEKEFRFVEMPTAEDGEG